MCCAIARRPVGETALGGSAELPWAIKHVQLDKFNRISPIDSLQYFYKNHTTGL